MSGTEADVRRAQADAERAKTDFSNTLHQLQSRLSPKRIATDALHSVQDRASSALHGVQDRGSHVAGDAVHAAQARPVAASSLLVSVLIVLARGPLLRLFNRLLHRDGHRADRVQVSPKLTHDENFTITAPVLDAKH
ncbi:MAG: hypothetical protein AVDCRST_MAG39-2538 [uncultured Sphingomonadaceae bacterium]|uniref:DUF3618 domain-containing protein n=1 Tax=uncultured Sphingomonadaceae bacterium TaxID=169976 RepID=A0A6J4T916_9SPHN|nr:MAG: hypothetical protein AVDCRST_MAG39-2538 [uncultured Sphingomonadaceae bacterium]